MYDYLRIPRRVEITAILYAGWGPAGRIYIVGFVVVLLIHRFSIKKMKYMISLCKEAGIGAQEYLKAKRSRWLMTNYNQQKMEDIQDKEGTIQSKGDVIA